MSGPLSGLKIIEFTGLGPAPLAGQLLADLGADVITVDRKIEQIDKTDINRRGKRSIVLDLKSQEGIEIARQLCNRSDIVIEAFRPGVMEKLGLGPEDLSQNIIYGRLTGWGQTGPNANMAGHDINYIALTGALHAIGRADAPPIPPLNLIGDYAGGTMFFLFGILAALYERQASGKGQVVDVAMVDGVPAMMGLIHTLLARGEWQQLRETNLLDGGAPFYRCYETKDGGSISVGALEPKFFNIFIELSGLSKEDLENQYSRSKWPEMHTRYEKHFKTKTRDEWTSIFKGSDACVAPVLDFNEAASDPHMRSRGVFVNVDGILQSTPAPHFSRSEIDQPNSPGAVGADTQEILQELAAEQAR